MFLAKGLAKGLAALASVDSNAGTVLNFGEGSDAVQVITTALLAEGGYSYVYSVKEVGRQGRTFAAKKVLAQDAETRAIAEAETRCLQQFDGHQGFVRCFGAMSKPLPHKSVEYWMLLEFCPNGSLIDVIYRKDRSGAFERRPALPAARILELFEMVVASVAHMHAQEPPVSHRDLKLENVLGTADGRYVLCDFGSATTATLPAERTRREAVVEEERIHKYSTLMYRAPEMVDMYRNQEVGVKVDVWSLGCILYSLCFREHPFAEESSLQILNAAYTIPADSPYLPRMHKLIAALLQPDPAVRPHAKDVLAAVQRLRAAEATEGSKAPASAKSPAPATPSSAGSARSQARTHALHANSSESSGGAAPPSQQASRPPSTSAAGPAGPTAFTASDSFSAKFDEAVFADFDAASGGAQAMRARAAVCVRLSVGAGDADGTRLVRVSLSPFPTSDAAADAGEAIAPAAAFAEEGVFGETGWEASFASDPSTKGVVADGDGFAAFDDAAAPALEANFGEFVDVSESAGTAQPSTPAAGGTAAEADDDFGDFSSGLGESTPPRKKVEDKPFALSMD